MESLDFTQDDRTSSPEYSVYSRGPSETNVELSSSGVNLDQLAEALKTAISESDDELSVITAASYSHDMHFIDDLESGEDYSIYSPTPSEVDVEFDTGYTDYPEVEAESVKTALLAEDSDAESDISTAQSMDSVSTSKSFMDQASVYVPKPSTTLVEFDDIVTGDLPSPLAAVTAPSYSCYTGLPSETECEIPFTYNVGGAKVVDSIEMIHLKNTELKLVKFYGVDKYLCGVEQECDVDTEANNILARNDTSGINLNDSDELEASPKEATSTIPQ